MSRSSAVAAGTHEIGVRSLPMAGYWPGALRIASIVILVVAVRLHEFIPLVGLLKPVLAVSVVGAAMLFSHSAPAVKDAVLRHKLIRLMIAYFCWAAVTVPFALWPMMAFNTWKGLLPTMLMMMAILFCPPTRESLDRITTSFVVMVMIYAAYAQITGTSYGGRLGGVGGMYDANDMASLMAMAFPLAAGMLTRSVPGRARTAAILAVIALGLGVIATGSRGGVLALLVGAVVFGLGFRGGRSFVIIAALVIAGLVGWFTAPPDFRARMETLTNLESDYNYTADTGRKAVWARGRGYIKEYPLFGVGGGNFPIAEGGSLEDEGRTGKWSAAHNAYIQAYAELGLIGGSLFVGMLLLAGRRALPMWRVRRAPPTSRATPLDRPEFLAALAAFSAGAYFLSHAYFGPAFAVLGFIALADRVRASEAVSGLSVPATSAPAFVRPAGQRGGLAVQLRTSTSSRGA